MQSGYNYRIIKGTVACNDFWHNLTHLVEKEKIYNFFHGGSLLIEMCSVFLSFSSLCVFSIFEERKKIVR
jgi:hypothetical protein